MSLPTTLIVPNNLVAGTDALAADLNGNNSYITSALNTTNAAVNANTDEIAIARSGELSLGARIDGVSAVANAALPASYLDTDGTLVGNSDVKVPSQKAVKTYVTTTAFSAALPLQTGNAGKFVTTDGIDASWAAVPPPQIIRVERTSNTMLGADDRQKLIDITSGTFTQTFDAAATLGDGWYCYIRNSGTGDITLDPNASETIDGLTSYIMYPGEVRLIQFDGTALRSVVLQSFYKVFTATATFVKPPGYNQFAGLAWSGGQSGAKVAADSFSRGGAGGGCFDFHILAADMAATETVTVGSGGAARTTDGNGNAGGATSIGSFFTITGGSLTGGSVAGTVGPSANISATGYQGGNFVNNNLASCSSEWGGASSSSNGTYDSGNSIWGGAAGGAISSGNVARNGGTSINGGNGGNASVASDGADGTVPGGGGGATQTGTQSGAGARGEVRIWGVL